MDKIQPKPCPECGGERIEAEHEGQLTRRVSLKPDIWHGQYKSKSSYVKALVCTACGYTVLYAKNPLDLIDKRPDRAIK